MIIFNKAFNQLGKVYNDGSLLSSAEEDSTLYIEKTVNQYKLGHRFPLICVEYDVNKGFLSQQEVTGDTVNFSEDTKYIAFSKNKVDDVTISDGLDYMLYSRKTANVYFTNKLGVDYKPVKTFTGASNTHLVPTNENYLVFNSNGKTKTSYDLSNFQSQTIEGNWTLDGRKYYEHGNKLILYNQDSVGVYDFDTAELSYKKYAVSSLFAIVFYKGKYRLFTHLSSSDPRQLVIYSTDNLLNDLNESVTLTIPSSEGIFANMLSTETVILDNDRLMYIRGTNIGYNDQHLYYSEINLDTLTTSNYEVLGASTFIGYANNNVFFHGGENVYVPRTIQAYNVITKSYNNSGLENSFNEQKTIYTNNKLIVNNDTVYILGDTNIFGYKDNSFETMSLPEGVNNWHGFSYKRTFNIECDNQFVTVNGNLPKYNGSYIGSTNDNLVLNIKSQPNYKITLVESVVDALIERISDSECNVIYDFSLGLNIDDILHIETEYAIKFNKGIYKIIKDSISEDYVQELDGYIIEDNKKIKVNSYVVTEAASYFTDLKGDIHDKTDILILNETTNASHSDVLGRFKPVNGSGVITYTLSTNKDIKAEYYNLYGYVENGIDNYLAIDTNEDKKPYIALTCTAQGFYIDNLKSSRGVVSDNKVMITETGVNYEISFTLSYGSFDITLYRFTGDRREINKKLNPIETLTITARNDLNILNPTIYLARTKIDFNYVYIKPFNRYYFVNSYSCSINGIWTVSLSIDVLKSHELGIKQLVPFVDRYEYSNYFELIDGHLPLKNQTTYEDLPVIESGLQFNTNPRKMQSGEELYKNSSYVITLSGYYKDKEYLMHQQYETPTNKQNVAGELTSDGSTTISYLLGHDGVINLLDALRKEGLSSYAVNVTSYPIDLEDFKYYFTDNQAGLIGDTNPIEIETINDKVVKTIQVKGLYTYWPITKGFTQINYAKIKLDIPNKYGRFLLFNPYSYYRIWAPYYGWIDIDSQYIYPKTVDEAIEINVYYNFDFTLQKAIITITNQRNDVIFSSECTVGIALSISSDNIFNLTNQERQLKSDMIFSTISSALSIGAAGMTGNLAAAAGAAVSGAQNMINYTRQINNLRPTPQVNMGTIQASLVNRQDVVFRRYYQDPVIDVNTVNETFSSYRRTFGLPYEQFAKIGNLKGLIVVREIKVSNIDATSEEIRSIESLLRSGVIMM